jgi:hypothetical protein
VFVYTLDKSRGRREVYYSRLLNFQKAIADTIRELSSLVQKYDDDVGIIPHDNVLYEAYIVKRNAMMPLDISIANLIRRYKSMRGGNYERAFVLARNYTSVSEIDSFIQFAKNVLSNVVNDAIKSTISIDVKILSNILEQYYEKEGARTASRTSQEWAT